MFESVLHNRSPLLRRLIFFFSVALVNGYFFPVTAMAGQVVLDWDINSEPELTGYVVYWGTTSRIYSDSVDVGNQNTYTISGLIDGNTYFFSVTAYDGLGNESSYSDEVHSDVSAVDSDQDGLTDSDEINTYGTNPFDADSDIDGAADGLEVLYLSDPLDDQSIPYCAADFDHNGQVGNSDLTLFMAEYGGTACSTICSGDFDNDGDVDGKDFTLFTKSYGKLGCL